MDGVEFVYLHFGVVGGDFVGCFFFFKQKTAYEMRISDWSSDVCSSDLEQRPEAEAVRAAIVGDDGEFLDAVPQQAGDQMFRIARKPEPAGHDGHPVEENALKRCISVGKYLAL